MKTTTAEQDRALEMLRANGIVEFSAIKSVPQLNALRDLCKKGRARFARFSAQYCGYILVGHSTLDEVA